jgi:hypothetical protein
MKKVVGSGTGSRSGSNSQRYGSGDPDPDPHQRVTDPQHCNNQLYPCRPLWKRPMEELFKIFQILSSVHSIKKADMVVSTSR